MMDVYSHIRHRQPVCKLTLRGSPVSSESALKNDTAPMQKRKSAAIFLAVVVLSAAGGWFLGQQITSPAEIAARSAAPEPTPIFATVETRVLATNVVTRGTGRYGTPRDLGLVPSILTTDQKVVTFVPDLGHEATEGDILLTASGRPLIIIEGSSPAYRDLGPGLVGQDVTQLEAALERLGHSPGPVDGVYDAETEAAVRRLYDSIGYAPAVVTSSQLDELTSAASAVHAGSRLTAGVLVAADEIYFTDSLPVRVTEILTEIGQPIDGPIVTITDAQVAIDGSVPIEQSSLIQVGMPVSIDEPDLGVSANGIISRVAEGPGTDGVDGFHVYFEVTVEDAAPNLINASVRLTIPIESTDAAVLVVPITAVNLATDGSSIVHVSRAGVLEQVAIQPGLSAQGFVEVTPTGGALEAGDRVLIGFDQPVTVDPAATPTGSTSG